ncbi:cystinosin homolog [Drosophila innubila]|uniref:cystinosin homolog n=1 Tax=Drosophila innubila TaxID=198719 RepID=UPI00148D9746|nr:cystinosin homolog [Drosophila innubila]XP_034488954.1 cystinosin homolog [Drosophila innubila]
MAKVLRYFVQAVAVVAMIGFGDAQDDRGFTVNTHDLTVLVNANKTFEIYTRHNLDDNINVKLIKQHEDHLNLYPDSFVYQAGSSFNQTITVIGRRAGHVEITASSDPSESWITNDIFVRVVVAKSEAIIYTSIVVGWIYFVAWSVSFYPQIWTNYRRKSVEGLNFDFLTLNIVGFTLYSMFNIGLYFFHELQDEYAERNPRGVNPVMLNDVVFSLHAMFATCITIAQCFMYEHGMQRVSKIAFGLLAIFALVVIISAGLAGGAVIHWLDFLYYCSYVKLTITIIKYIPQALMNFRRKSTVGWSIGNILLDFTGGTLSMLQMILSAHNYDDWASIFGDPTKFGLGLFSVLFDIFFMLQHYVFYRRSNESSSSDLTTDTRIQDETQSASIEKF